MDTAFDYGNVWNITISQIKNDLGEQEYNLWFDLTFLRSEKNEIIVLAPSSYIRDQIKTRFSSMIESKFQEISGEKITFTIEINSKDTKNQAAADIKPQKPSQETNNFTNTQEPAKTPTFQPPKIEKKIKHTQLKKEYSFNTYIIGGNNRFATNTAMAVSKNLGKAYNPLLIYGGVGLGKTHLMQAIGNYVHENSESKIIFVTAETFMNEFIESINDKKSASTFRNKYRHIDLLMMDDIHSLKKEAQSTLEELFNTYEALHNTEKQMVFTCDRPVSELKNLTERLKSRFSSGLHVDLQPPDYETRCAIIKSKAKFRGILVPDDVIALVSKNITSNVRDIEAALKKLFAYNELEKRPITVEIAQKQLKDVFASPKQSNISIEVIQRVVAENFSLGINDLRGKKKTQNIVRPRHLAMFIARELTEYSTTEIGQAFGGRDHTTVISALDKIEKLLKSNPSEDAEIQCIMRTVKEQSVK
jgi:chromosomal replication initiator protein